MHIYYMIYATKYDDQVFGIYRLKHLFRCFVGRVMQVKVKQVISTVGAGASLMLGPARLGLIFLHLDHLVRERGVHVFCVSTSLPRLC